MSLSDHARANRSAWGAMAADHESAGRRHWADNEITWGMWEIPEAQLGSPAEEIWVARLDGVREGASAAV